MATKKLYWDDPFLVSFEAARACAAHLGERPSLVLDRTAFYPEGGGQLADVGTLAIDGVSLRVSDVQIDDAGVIHHLIDGPWTLEREAVTVRGAIDAARRQDHMAQHTAQHMVSCALADIAGAHTVSARLGRGSCTIDVDSSALSERALVQIEDRVNAVVRDDRLVVALYPTDAELTEMKLRRAPKVSQGVRVIDIEDFDRTPCGGTHCTRTGQIGAVSIVDTEAYKRGLRVSFHAAGRATTDARARASILRELAADLTCGPADVPAALAKLRADLKAKIDLLSSVRGELVELVASLALEANPVSPSGTTPIVVVREKDDLGLLRTLAGRLAARPDVVAVCAAVDGVELVVVVQRGASARFDAGAWFKRAAGAHGGRGGGRPERAEGRLPSTIDLAAALLEST